MVHLAWLSPVSTVYKRRGGKPGGHGDICHPPQAGAAPACQQGVLGGRSSTPGVGSTLAGESVGYNSRN